MNHLELNYLVNESVSVYQHPDHFRINTDTRLLAEFLELKRNLSILDIGTNNAALLVYCDRFEPEKLIGVEVLSEACKVAQINAKHFISHDCEIINDKVQNIDIEPVDLIISNPPYFPIDHTNPNTNMDMRQLGRVEVNLTLEELVYHAARLLKPNGHFCFVHRPDRLNEIYQQLIKNGFSISRLQIAYDKNDVAKTILIDAKIHSSCQCKILPPITI